MNGGLSLPELAKPKAYKSVKSSLISKNVFGPTSAARRRRDVTVLFRLNVHFMIPFSLLVRMELSPY